MSEHALSEQEKENCLKVHRMLLELPGLGVKTLREDYFEVTEPETGVQFTVDVEEDILFLRADVAEVKNPSQDLLAFLLRSNGAGVHVAWGLDGDTVILKGNLEIENLDPNELEASCKALILTLYNASDELSNLV